MVVRLIGLGTYVQTEHDDVDEVEGRGEIDIVHDQSLVVSEARVGVDYGVNEWLSASVVLPVRVVRTAITYYDPTGAEVQLVRDGIHHRDEVVSGIADPMVMGAVSGVLGGAGVAWSVRGGVTVPIGRTEEDPFVAGDMDVAHQHIQLGTGTVNPVLGVDVGKSWGAWRVGGFAFTQQVLYENGKGYHAGDRYAGGVTVRRAFGKWGVRGGVEMQGETAEKWGGVSHTDDGNRGRFDAMVATGVSWAMGSGLTVDLAVKVPVVTHVVGGQLDMPAIAEVGLSWGFGGKKAEAEGEGEGEHDHDHGHEHGEHEEHGDEHGHDGETDEHGHDHDQDEAPYVHPDTTGLDVLDVGKPGEAVALVPVPGKVTIFDFWATWCEPCKTLEPALVEMVRKNPDKVALRRIDAVDWDSAAVATYLTPGGFNLPHVKVFDASGKMVLERGAEPGKLDEMIEAIRTVVETPQTQPQPQPQPQPQAQPIKPVIKPVMKPVSVKVIVTEKGFEPGNVTVPRGRPVTLVFERKTAKTCATEVIFVVDGKRVEQKLPLDTPVPIKVTFQAPGTIKYACAMNMVGGTITVR